MWRGDVLLYTEKPKYRSPFRIYLGKKYYRLKRYVDWYVGNKKFALTKKNEPFHHLVFQHKTPLYRKLKDVDMWLQHNKVKNLQIAIKRLNTIVIKPGETFSYWRLIGSTSKRKGYVDAMILFYGKVLTGIGGGLCQLSNLIYWMTLHTPLTVTERYRHSYDVFPDAKRSQPFGSGATCAYNYLDLQIKNDTPHDYQLVVYLTDTHLVGEWRCIVPPTKSYDIYEKDHWINQELWGGYTRHNKIYRKVYNLENELIDDELVAENHAIMMYDPLLSDGSVEVKKES
jgi:vancomycin resistance protein VanW